MRLLHVAWLMLLVAAAWDAPATAQIASHRAAYTLSLGSAKGSSVGALEGAMYIDWHEACDGWTINQRMRFQIYDESGQAIDNDISFSSWEAKNGLSYRFTLRSIRNGEIDEELRGYAELDGPGKAGRAVFTMPEDATMELPAGTLFPTEHTIQLLQKAKAGEKVFARPVFDGATLDGALLINALILQQLPPVAAKDPKVDATLLNRPSWRVRMAFFKLEDSSAEPEYETGLQLLDNGVGTDFLFDYTDFSIRAKLQQLAPLPKPRC
ncbi:MAG TPA: cell envelope integrity EipB family protein [Alphaproteobacteria bacterium]